MQMQVVNKFFINDRYVFSPNERTLVDKEQEDSVTQLGNNESNILLSFIERPNEVLSRNQIHDLVWTSNGIHVDESSVIQAISTVRKLLNDSVKSPKYIKTVPKRGYQFIARYQILEEPEEDNKEPSKTLTSPEEPAHKPTDINSEKKSSKTTLVKSDFLNSKAYVLAALVVLVVTFWFINKIAPEQTEFIEMERIHDIPVYSMNQGDRDLYMNSSISGCIQDYIEQTQNINNIEKIIATFSSQDDLSINFVNKDKMESITYAFIAEETEMSQFCRKSFNNVKK